MSNYYRYIVKGAERESFSTVNVSQSSVDAYGTVYTKNYPLTSSISVLFFPDQSNIVSNQYGNPSRLRLKTFKSLLTKYRKYSEYFQYSSSAVDYDTSDICLINIPSIFYGSSIDKGSVELSIYANGILLAKAQDISKNGELIQTTGSASIQNDRSVVGTVLYDEGLIALFDRTPLAGYQEDFYAYSTPSAVNDYPRWSNYGLSANILTGSVLTTSCDLQFDGINKIPQLTLLAHANKTELNNSTNYTYTSILGSSSLTYNSSSYRYIENPSVEIKNVVKSRYLTPTASFAKETYITKILLYDENKNIIGIAKIAKPIRKTEDRDFTFKLKIDL